MAEAKVTARSDLLKIADDLKVIQNTAAQTGQALGDAGKEVAKGVNDQVAVVDAGMKRLRKAGNELAKQLGSDFKALFSAGAVMGGLKLSGQFADSVKQAVTLNDTIRNLSPIFGMNEAAAEKFKRTMVKSLSEIGVGSDAAANALQGLAETNVRGDKNLTAYARTSSELAGISKQKGQEGNIAKGLAGVVVAQGGNPNDPAAMQKVAEDIVRIRNATGKTATEALETLNKLFSSANTDFKKRLGQGGGVSLASAGLIGGQGSTAFLERYMGLSSQERSGYDAQGLGRLVGKNGQLNGAAFQDTIAEAKSRGSGNAEFGLKTMGMTDEEAKGFLRLADAMKTNGDAIEKARAAAVDINGEYAKTMSMGDAFRANINRVKGGVSDLMDRLGAPDILNKGTDFLQGASQSPGGAAAVVGGSALLAAVLTGGGLKGIGGALFGDEAKKAAIEGLTGEKVQRVEVINWPMTLGGANGAWSPWSGAGGAAATTAGGAIGLTALEATGIGAVATAGVAGIAYNSQNGVTAPGSVPGIGSGSLGNGSFDFSKFFGGLKDVFSTHLSKDVRVTVDSKDKSLKAFKEGSRGVPQ